jgi:hypothetical protein
MKGRIWAGWSLWLVASSLLLGALVGCGDSVGAGALTVHVKDVSMAAVPGATVTTDPATDSLTTDMNGTARFAKLSTGYYAVTAQAAIGVARAAVTVKSGGDGAITLILKQENPSDAGAGGQDSGAGSDGASPDGGVSSDGSADGSLSTGVVLAPLTKDGSGINLSWSTPAGVTFSSYRVYSAQTSGSFQVINIINTAATTTYRDETVRLGVSYAYRIGAVTSTGQEVSSNVQTITAGVFIEVNSQVAKMKTDSMRPYLYAVDSVNNALHFVNLTTNTVEETIFIGSNPTDLDINVEGTELFVANFGGTEIAVVDLDTRMKARSLFVDTSAGGSIWEGNPYRLVCASGDALVFTSQDQWNDLKLVTAADGTHLATVGELYTPALGRSADGRRIYATGSIDGGLTRYDISGSTLTEADASTSSGAVGAINATQDGMFVFSGTQKLLANNLKSAVGSFSEPILVASGDGSVAVSSMTIFNGTTFASMKRLPLSTPVMALSADGHTLYLYDTSTSRIYVYQI